MESCRPRGVHGRPFGRLHARRVAGAVRRRGHGTIHCRGLRQGGRVPPGAIHLHRELFRSQGCRREIVSQRSALSDIVLEWIYDHGAPVLELVVVHADGIRKDDVDSVVVGPGRSHFINQSRPFIEYGRDRPCHPGAPHKPGVGGAVGATARTVAAVGMVMGGDAMDGERSRPRLSSTSLWTPNLPEIVLDAGLDPAFLGWVSSAESLPSRYRRPCVRLSGSVPKTARFVLRRNRSLIDHNRNDWGGREGFDLPDPTAMLGPCTPTSSSSPTGRFAP